MKIHTMVQRLVRNLRTLGTSRANSQYVPYVLRTMLLLLMMTVGATTAWGQTDYSGTWYIQNMQQTNNTWYLVPCMGGGYYNDNEETPFLTTYQTNQDMNSLWRLEKVTVDATDYYRFIHNATGLYVTYNEAVLDYSENNNFAPRLRLHLEAFETPTDATLFFIQPHASNGRIAIRPKDGYDDVNNYYWWDIGQNNNNNYWNTNWQGELGLWNKLTEVNNACKWNLITANPTCATPVITYDESAGSISLSYPIAGDGGVTIYYTTDGSEPTSSSSTYSAAFSATGVKMVRAIAVKDGYDNSAEVKLYSPTQPWLFKTTDDANVSYYMIPPTDDDRTTDLNVTTSNVPNERMQWLLKPAVLRTGVQYYYFVNAATGKYAYCDANINSGNALLMKDLGEEGTENDRYMFRLIDYTTYLNIVPKSFARLIPSSNNKNCLRKQNATDHTNPIGVYQDEGGLSRWTATALPADPKSLWPLPTELVSSTGDVKYLKLRNGLQTNSADYFVYPPSANTYCTAATTGDHSEWYLWPADDSDLMAPYYYIRNAYTGQYLYFDGVAYNNNDNKFFTSTTDQGDKSKFLVLRTANTNYSGSYHIVPKLIRNNNNQVQIALNRNNATLRTIQARNTSASCWFFDATTFTCDAPTFSYDAVQGVLSMASPNNAPIYYVGWNDGDSEPSLTTPAEGTLYTDPIDVNCTHYKAIAARNTDGSDKSSAATYDLAASFQCATPIISFNSSTKKMSIASATASATIYYIVGDGTFSESATDYGGMVYSEPFTLANPVVVKAIAVRNGDWNTVSVVKVWDEAPHYIDKASEMTNMGLNYVANEGFTVDTTIGTSSDPFTGTFDGAYTSFSLSSSLFGYVDGATVKNVRVSSASVSGTGHKGAIVNEATGNAHIYNCGVLAGSVTSSDAAAGGLVGHIASGSSVRVVNCYNYATISGSTHAAGIVGWNEGTVDGTTTVSGTGVRIANCMMYGDITSGKVISPVYCGNHTNNQQKLTEYNFYRSRANLTYTAYNDQLAIGSDENLYRFPFYRHILNTHRELAAYFLFADHTDEHVLEIGHWVLDTDIAPYPIVEPWETNTKRTTVDIEANLPNTTEKFAGKLLNGIGSDGYYTGDGTLVTAMGSSGYLAVTVKIGSQTYNASLPITDMNESRYDYTWGKVVLPHANEFSGWTRDYDYICTGWKITSVTKDGSALTTFNIPSSEPYNFANRDNAQKDIYNATSNPYVFAQGGYYIVPYGVTAITIEAHFAKAFYLSDPYADVGYKSDYKDATNLGWQVPTTYHGKTVYTSLSTLVGQLSNATNPNDQAIVLVGNFHHRVTGTGDIYLNTARAVTIMSCDEDNNQEPDYAWYMGNTLGRMELPPIRFDVPNIEIGMAARVNGSSGYPGVGIWHVHGWFELTENSLNNSSQFEINSRLCNNTDNGSGNNRWIANSGCFVQVVRCRQGDCSKLSYIQIGGNAYIKELYPGSHTDNGNITTSVPIMVTGGQVDECYMTGYTSKGGKDDKAGTLSGDMIYFWSAGGKIKKFLGAYLEEPTSAGLTAKIDHANIIRFFGGGTSAAARIKGNIDITINNSKVDFYCGGPEFGDMYDGKILATHATGTTFGEYYGAGFGGTSITYVRKDQNDKLSISTSSTYDLNFNNYTNNRLGVDATYGIGTCYKFEFIFNSNATQLVTRFYTGYAQFSLATTGNVTNALSHCVIEKDFYGAGCQGKVNGTVTSTLTDCEVKGSAFGGGYKATSNEVSVYPTTQPTYSVFTKETGLFSDFGTVAPVTFTWVQGTSSKQNTADDCDANGAGGKLYTSKDINMTDLGNVTGNISLTIDGGAVAHDVYGGGNESKSLNNATVNIKGGTVSHDVYGGGNKADVNGDTEVNLTGGTVNENVYGGGRGTDGSDGNPAVAALVGSTLVKLNGTETVDPESGAKLYNDNCVVNGNIFGCNNINGTPKGNATVHIYKTWGTERTSADALDDIDDSKHKYHLQAVYGGGNLAAYDPDEPGTKKAYVIIDGCDLTSIRQVYGGGNAASTPATQVDVNGTYEIEEVFGGGNGKDPIPYNGSATLIENPGANVGYYNYATYDEESGKWVDNDDADTKEKRQATGSTYLYGTGKANVNIYGGLVHRVYGGSNTKGNVCQVAVTMLDKNTDCEFKVDEAYGGGKSAPMDGAANLVMACIPGLKSAYGGAENANINDNVTLNITNGNFERVFGGNNVAGTINGTITVNIEETGCKPVIIGQLYGGGNQAAYTGPLKAGSGTDRQGPTVNVRSFTSIGDVFGGGYGQTAVVTGDTHVNINEVNGKYYKQATSEDSTGNKEFKFTQFKRVEPTANNPDGFVYNDETGERETEDVTIDVYLPPHAANAMGSINNVYGGGNAAKVFGNTNVNIGTEATTDFVTKEEGATKPATGVSVLGASIVGNVYGGGNQAEVTGDTHVVIGKKATTTP